MKVSINGHELTLELADNTSAQALAQLATADGLRLTLQDYGGFEKVGPLPRRLPTNDERITTRPGDVILYQGDKLAIYYATNTWEFTRLGRITGVDSGELRTLLGEGGASVTLRSE